MSKKKRSRCLEKETLLIRFAFSLRKNAGWQVSPHSALLTTKRSQQKYSIYSFLVIQVFLNCPWGKNDTGGTKKVKMITQQMLITKWTTTTTYIIMHTTTLFNRRGRSYENMILRKSVDAGRNTQSEHDVVLFKD